MVIFFCEIIDDDFFVTDFKVHISTMHFLSKDGNPILSDYEAELSSIEFQDQVDVDCNKTEQEKERKFC